MTVALLLVGIGVGLGWPAVLIGALALAAVWPLGFLLAAVGWGLWNVRGRLARPQASEEADFLRAVAAELRAGASLRSGLAAAGARAGRLSLSPVVRLATAGRPSSAVAEALEAALPVNGRLAAAAVRLASSTGAKSAALFADLASRAAQASELSRERRALTAQARLSAGLIGGAPLAFVLLMSLVGQGPRFSGPGLMVTLIGFSLIAAGESAVWMMLRRAEV